MKLGTKSCRRWAAFAGWALAGVIAGTTAFGAPQETPPRTVPKPANTNATPREPSGGPGQGPAWKEFRHPTGLRLRHPPDWQLTHLPTGLLLVPPDLAVGTDGPDEAYLIGAESAAGISAPDDPRVGVYLDQQMAQLAPFMKRAGTPEKVDCATTPGSLVRWEGRNPKGDLVKAQGYTTILKGYGVVLFAIGKEASIAPREKTLRAVFSSLAAGEGEKDPRLVGRWRFWSYTASKVGNLGTERTRWMVLKADGSCTWASQSETSGTLKGGDSLGNETWVGGIAGTSRDADRGTWSAGDGKLFVQWQDGTLGTWEYRLTGETGQRRLFLSGSGNQPDEWVEVR